MLFFTVRQASSRGCWKTTPILTSERVRVLTFLPARSTCPLVASSRPLMMLSSVDLPQPDGPRMESRAPSSTWTCRSPSTFSGACPRRGNSLWR
jgi:hypothetical protein